MPNVTTLTVRTSPAVTDNVMLIVGSNLYSATLQNVLALGSGTGMANPMTTYGDIITGGASGAATRLGIGAQGQPLAVSGVAPFLSAPAATSGLTTATTGGTVAAGTYRVVQTYVNAQGETTGSTYGSVTTTGTTSTFTIPSPAASGSGSIAATGWYAYVSQAGGTVTRRQTLTPTAIGTSFVVTAPPQARTIPTPTVNTAGTLGLNYGPGAGGGVFLTVAASTASNKVKNAADYVCTGTNDQIQINAAITALGGTGGVVQLSIGTFNISETININYDDITLQGVYAADGDAGGGTILSAVTGLTGSVISSLYIDGSRPTAATRINSMFINGNTIGTGVNGVYALTYRGLIERVFVNNCTGHGIWVQGVGTFDAYDTYINFCQSWQNGGDGLHWGGSDGHILSCIVFSNTGNGLGFSGSSMQITQCHFYSNHSAGIQFTDDGARTKISNCKLEGNNGGIIIAGTTGPYDIQMSNCGFMSNNTYASAGVAGTHSNIEVTNSAWVGNLQINSCNFGDYLTNGAVTTAGAQATPVHDISFNGNNVRRPVITGNAFSGADDPTPTTMANKININGAFNPIIRNNNGYITESAGVSTQSPGVISTVFIAHGLAVTPTSYNVSAANVAARNLSPLPHITVTATNIILNFGANLVAGTSYSWNWNASFI